MCNRKTKGGVKMADNEKQFEIDIEAYLTSKEGDGRDQRIRIIGMRKRSM